MYPVYVNELTKMLNEENSWVTSSRCVFLIDKVLIIHD